MKNTKVDINKLPSANNWLAKSLKDPEFKKEYDKLQPEYELINKLIEARIKKKMTQKDIADRMGTKQSALARLESGHANPTISFIQKLATALGTDITLTFPGK
ncbi:helix-turn-helix transcriptional regulator [Candidatus Shapirobacteria bacterium]|nr:helix-turn-helix transcriptional regulator [Candidatus Shapirobacteria bacterium]